MGRPMGVITSWAKSTPQTLRIVANRSATSIGSVGDLVLPSGSVRTDDEAALESAAAEQARKTARPVIAAVERIYRGAAAELTDDQHDRRLPKVTVPQIAEEGGQCRIEHAGIVAMTVEIVRVRVEAGQRDFDGGALRFRPVAARAGNRGRRRRRRRLRGRVWAHRRAGRL